MTLLLLTTHTQLLHYMQKLLSSPPCPLSVGLQLVVAVQPLACCVDRGVELEVEVTGKVLHVGREGECLLLLGVQLQEGPAEKHIHSSLAR